MRSLLTLWLVLASFLAQQALYAQESPFRLMVDSLLIDVAYGDVAWGDYDRDGDFDLVITGNLSTRESPLPTTRLFNFIGDREYENLLLTLQVSDYEQVDVLQELWYSTAAWGDYDADGDLDLLIAGMTASDGPITYLYNNNSGAFTLHTNLLGLYEGDVAWGDYDSDGDLDILAAGIDASGEYHAVIYDNEAGRFMERNMGLTGLAYASVAWGDYDNDGDLDIVMAGMTEEPVMLLKVYRNEGQKVFVDALSREEGLFFPAVDWGDYDNDGDLDIVLNGAKLGPFMLEGKVRVYRNDGGLFVQVGSWAGNYMGDVAWGDYTSDGQLDFMTVGGVRPRSDALGMIYQNIGGAFIPRAMFAGGVFGTAEWGDYDGDGDLDYVVSGQDIDAGKDVVNLTAEVYRNELRVGGHLPPPPPVGLDVTVEDGHVVFSWDAPPGEGLSYNLRVGTLPGASDVVPAMALPSGRRLLSARGNVGHRLEWSIDLPLGYYYWSVQSLDAGYSGSAFAPEESFTTGDENDETPPATPVGFIAQTEDIKVLLSWQPNTEPDLARYLIYRGTTPENEVLFAAVEPGMETYTDSNVQNGKTYYYRLQAQDIVGNTSPYTATQIARPLQRFLEVNSIGLPQLFAGRFAWGDYDTDGDPDLVFASRGVFRTYSNNNGFFERGDELINVGNYPSIAWGDYDGDSDLDLVMTGPPDGVPTSENIVLYRYDAGFFSLVEENGLPNVASGTVSWADYNGDGNQDLLLTGRGNNGQRVRAIYRNDGGVFVDSGINLSGPFSVVAAWGDYDADGDPDLVMANEGVGSYVYQNDKGAFTLVANVYSDLTMKVAWGDYDSDGDLDLLVADIERTRLYRNDNGTFVDTNIELPVLTTNRTQLHFDVTWVDYDLDGHLDLFFAGNGYTVLYRNTGAEFIRTDFVFPSFLEVDVGWADYDSDGDLDVLMAGQRADTLEFQTILYENNTIIL